MKRVLVALTLSAALLGGAGPVLSAEQTAALGVDLWCPSCSHIVQRSLERVAGVLEVTISYEEQVAVVRFDDAKTDVTALIQATAEIGFPSELVAAP